MADLGLQSFGSAWGAVGGPEQGLGDFNYGFMDSTFVPGPTVASPSSVSAGSSTLSSSEYLRRRYASLMAEPVREYRPRPRVTPTFPAPNEAPNSVGAYYRKKFAAFYDPNTEWKQIGFPPSVSNTPAKETIAGTTHITIEDLLMLIQVIARELVRVANLRSSDPDTLTKQKDMDLLLGDLRSLSASLDRRDIREYQIPIRAGVARTFLATFRDAVVLPPLLDRLAAPPVQAIPTLGSSGGAADGTVDAVPKKRGPDIVLLFQDIQQTRWALEASLDPRIEHYKEMLDRLTAMERRIVSYTTSDTPMPPVLQMEFEEELRRLRQTYGLLAGAEPE